MCTMSLIKEELPVLKWEKATNFEQVNIKNIMCKVEH